MPREIYWTRLLRGSERTEGIRKYIGEIVPFKDINNFHKDDFEGETQLIAILKMCYNKLKNKENQYLQYSDEEGNRITVNFLTNKVVKEYKNLGYKQR